MDDLPVGDYVVTLINEKGNIYYRDKVSFWYDVQDGYIDDFQNQGQEYYCKLSVKNGNYETRDSEARIVCKFNEKLSSSERENITFWFVDSDNNRTIDYTYGELKAGLVWLPKDKTYKLVASGLPEGIELDYSNMSDIRPVARHCGAEHSYRYTVKYCKAEAPAPVITYPNGKVVETKVLRDINFTIKATSSEKLTYCWYYKKTSADGGDGKFHKSGCTAPVYTRTANYRRDGMQAYCVVTDANGKTTKSDVITFKLVR